MQKTYISSKMFWSYFNMPKAVVLIFLVQWCIANGQLHGSTQSVAKDMLVLYTNSTYQSAFETGPDDSTVQKSKRSTRCGQDQPTLIRGYYYKFHLQPPHQSLNEVFSVGYAYLLAIEHRLLKSSHRYFNIHSFPHDLEIDFPPTLPIVCYDIGHSMEGAFPFQYQRKNIISDLKFAAGPYASHWLLTRRLVSSSEYMVQRHKMYGELGILVGSVEQEQKQQLQTKCSQVTYRKITELINELLGNSTSQVIQVMSPAEYALEQFNAAAKLFIADITTYEIIRQACLAMGSRRIPQVTDADWRPIAEKLRAASFEIRNNWHVTQLQKDVMSYEIPSTRTGSIDGKTYTDHPNFDSTFERGLADQLALKYYPYRFRVSSHKGWSVGQASMVCNGVPNLKCFDKPGRMVLVRWKSLLSTSVAASYDTPEQYVRFPQVRAPPPSHRYAALYSKVQTHLNKVQNAISLFRVTELQKKHYKLATGLFQDFDAGTQDIYTETTDGFAKVLDALNVFSREFQPSLNTLSQITWHTGETGIDSVWRLVDRSFFEMDYYLEDIKDHIHQIRDKVEETHSRLISPGPYESLSPYFASGSEELENVRKAFSEYRRHGRFYAGDDNIQGTYAVVGALITACSSLKNHFEYMPVGSHMRRVESAIEVLGYKGPLYVQMFYLAASHHIIRLNLHNMFCICQRYRWLSLRNLAEPENKMNIAHIQRLLANIQQDRVRIHRTLNEYVEDVAMYSDKGYFYWIHKLSITVDEERKNTDITNGEAQSRANKYMGMFPWNSFVVTLVQPSARLADHIPLNWNEKSFYYLFFWNPDYSMVRVDTSTKGSLLSTGNLP